MYILLAGVSHKTAPVELRERLALTGTALEQFYHDLAGKPPLEGVVILSTCNRTEVYASSRNVEAGSKALHNYLTNRLGLNEEQAMSTLYQPTCYGAVEHLFRVASGLESMVLGETQILGQVRDAYQDARERRVSDGVLNTLFQKAIYVGKRVRTDTGLDRHAVSISYAAVEKAKQAIGDLQGRSVLVIGAGLMSELTVKYLVANGVSTVIVSNRSYDRACQLAEQIGGEAIQFEQLPYRISEADIVISCTAAQHYVLRRDSLLPYLKDRVSPLVLIDIAVPRDIEPTLGEVPGIYLYDIDDLHNVIDANLLERQKAARRAETIIAEEIKEFEDWLATLYVIPVIRALKAKGAEICEAEIKRALNRLGNVSPREDRIIREMASSIISQMLHFPVINLKEVAVANHGHVYAEAIKNLFELPVDLEENDGYAQGENRY